MNNLPSDSFNTQNISEEEYELTHIPLMSVAKELWQTLEHEEYTDSNGNRYSNTFNGQSAVDCMVKTLDYATDEKEAIDYLVLIMDEEAVFSRIDVDAANKFEYDENAHYQWVSFLHSSRVSSNSWYIFILFYKNSI